MQNCLPQFGANLGAKSLGLSKEGADSSGGLALCMAKPMVGSHCAGLALCMAKPMVGSRSTGLAHKPCDVLAPGGKIYGC
jgi:hypothetical protein